MTFEEYTGKKCALITDRGYIYNHDKTKKTLSEKEAAEWYGCKEEDLVLIGTYPWYSSAVYFEKDPEVENAVKISYWHIRNSAPKQEDPLSVQYIGFFYLYNDGKVSYAAGCNKEHPEIPKRIRTRPYPLQRVEGLYWDYCQNMGCLNRAKGCWRNGPLGRQVREMLVNELNFQPVVETKYGYKIDINTGGATYGTLADWIASYPCTTSSSKTKEYLKLEKEESLKPMDANTIIKIERTSEGVLFRMKPVETNGYSDSLTLSIGDKEMYRYLFTNKGTCSRQKYIDTLNEWRRDDSKDTYNFYKIFYVLSNYMPGWKERIDGEFKDLFSTNKKFKYLNDWINNNIDMLFHIVKEPGTYGDNRNDGIIEFLRLYNKYPAFIDTLIKLGYFDSICIVKHKNQVYDYSAHRYIEKTPERIKCFDAEKFMRLFSFTDYYTRNASFLKPKSKDFFGCCPINKFQWKVINQLIKSYSTLSEVEKEGEPTDCWTQDCLSIIKYVNRLYCKTPGYGRGCEEGYDSVKDVPDNEFLKFIETCKELRRMEKEDIGRFNKALGNHYRSYTYKEESNMTFNKLNDVVASEYYVIGNDLHCRIKSSFHIEQYLTLKIVKKAYKEDIDTSLFRDYLNMRSQCSQYTDLGFNEAEWPEMPDLRIVDKLHDRLSELYNEYRIIKAEKEESERQVKWEQRIKKEKLLKFEYEEDDDERCVVLPRKLIELINEGQILHHCVGSYTTSVAEGNETILFLRNKASKGLPYATIDIAYDKNSETWKMRQVHTKYNGDVTKEDGEFLKRWGRANNVDEATIRTHTGALCHL